MTQFWYGTRIGTDRDATILISVFTSPAKNWSVVTSAIYINIYPSTCSLKVSAHTDPFALEDAEYGKPISHQTARISTFLSSIPVIKKSFLLLQNNVLQMSNVFYWNWEILHCESRSILMPIVLYPLETNEHWCGGKSMWQCSELYLFEVIFKSTNHTSALPIFKIYNGWRVILKRSLPRCLRLGTQRLTWKTNVVLELIRVQD